MRRFTIGDLEQTSEYCANYNIEIYMEYIYGNTSTHFLGWHCSETCSRSWGMLPSRPGTSLPTYRTTLHLHHRSTVYNTWNPRASAVHIIPAQKVDETQCGQGMLMGQQRLGVSRMAAADLGHRDDMGHYNDDHQSVIFLTQAAK